MNEEQYQEEKAIRRNEDYEETRAEEVEYTDEQSPPISQLEADYMTIRSYWGSKLPDDLMEDFEIINEKGSKRNIWRLMGFLTQDLRLANFRLDRQEGRIEYARCKAYLKFSMTMARHDFRRSFGSCLSEIAPTIELSQSTNGFLRNIMRTKRIEKSQNPLEPPKKGIFSFGNREGR